MFIIGTGTATPPHRYSQQECWTTLIKHARFQEFTPRSKAILKKVLTGQSGIVTRQLALDHLNQAFEITPDALHARFIKNAPALATAAAERALADSKTGPREIDAVLISTCTGYLCPGLTSYTSERLGLRPDVLALDLVGQGCHEKTGAGGWVYLHCRRVDCVRPCTEMRPIRDCRPPQHGAGPPGGVATSGQATASGS